MPLQLRRGTTAERLSIVPLPGEPILDTDLNTIFIGNGTTAGGVSALTGITSEDAMDIVGQMFLNGQHQGITFTYGSTQDAANRIDARLELSSYDGEFAASAFRGSLYANDSQLLVDGDTGAANFFTVNANTVTTDVLTANGLNMSGTITATEIVGDLKGSVFSDTSTILVDGTGGSINLDGTIKGDVIPAGNELYDLGSSSNKFKDLYLSGSINLDGTINGDVIPAGNELYDLGSSSNKFKDLYLSGSSIFLGDATITSSGTIVNLPAGSTVAGIPIGTGSGSGEGIIDGSDYNINIVADDSTILVNSSTKEFNGDLTGNVTGNVTGDVTGNIITNSISSADSSTIVADNYFRFSTFVDFDELVNFKNEGLFVRNESLERLATFSQHHENEFGSSITLRRSRGTDASPTVVIANDVVGDIDWVSFNGSSYVATATIKAVVDSNPSLGHVPGRLDFITNDNSGNAIRRMNIDSIGTISFETTIRQTLDTYASGAIQAGFFQSYDNADVRNFTFLRSRGSIASPTTLNNNDDLVDIVFSGHDGTDYRSGAGITAIVTGTPSGGFMPTRLVFQTDDGSSGLTGRVVVRPNGNLWCLYGLAVTGTITPIAVDDDLVLDVASVGVGTVDFKVPEQSTVGAAGVANALPATPSTYFKIKVNGVEYVVPAYAVS